MRQMTGGLNPRGCAGLPLPRDFGHFASPLWLNNEKEQMYKLKPANKSKQGRGGWTVLESLLCMRKGLLFFFQESTGDCLFSFNEQEN